MHRQQCSSRHCRVQESQPHRVGRQRDSSRQRWLQRLLPTCCRYLNHLVFSIHRLRQNKLYLALETNPPNYLSRITYRIVSAFISTIYFKFTILASHFIQRFRFPIHSGLFHTTIPLATQLWRCFINNIFSFTQFLVFIFKFLQILIRIWKSNSDKIMIFLIYTL